MAWCGAICAALTMWMGQSSAFGSEISKVIEIDGNNVDDSGAGFPVDWCEIDAAGIPGIADTFDGIQDDAYYGGPDANIFTTGGSKDEHDIPSWQHKEGNIPDKDNIANAGAALFISPLGHEILTFVADIEAPNGDAQIGFWFLQDAVGLKPDGTFEGMHIDGDILVLANFVNGGRVSDLEACTWHGVDNVTCQKITNFDDGDAMTNGDTLASCWPFQTKRNGFGANEYPATSYFEGAIDLTALGLGHKCFSSFIAETRSSQSIDAVLKDLVRGNFDVCRDICGVKESAERPSCVDVTERPISELCQIDATPLTLPDWEIFLYEDKNGNDCPEADELVTVNGKGESITNPVTTNASGAFKFEDMPNHRRSYIVCERLQACSPNCTWQECSPLDGCGGCAVAGVCPDATLNCYPAFNLPEDQCNDMAKDFRNIPIPDCADVNAVKFCDENGDGVEDPTVGVDRRIPGFCLVLTEDAAHGNAQHCAITDAAGTVTFTNIEQGQDVTVHEDLDGSECDALGCGPADNSADWVETTPGSRTVPVNATTVDTDPPFGNTSRPVCTPLPDLGPLFVDVNCDREFTFTPTATNDCGGVMIKCTAPGLTITPEMAGSGVLRTARYDGGPAGACPDLDTTVTCVTTTDATETMATRFPGLPRLEDTCPFDVTIRDNTKPVISCDSVTGENVDSSCTGDVVLNATITDNCCVDAANVTVTARETTGNGTLDPFSQATDCTLTQAADNRVTVRCVATVSDLTDCRANVQFTINASDCCGNAADQVQCDDDVRDVTAPVVTCTSTTPHNTGVDDCLASVDMTARVTDNCCVTPDDVTVAARELTGNASGFSFSQARDCTITQNGAKRVDVACTADIDGLIDCPAEVEFTTSAEDCCGNDGASDVCSAQVRDNIKPEITCPGDQELECGETFRFTPVVTDNCLPPAGPPAVRCWIDDCSSSCSATLGGPDASGNFTVVLDDTGWAIIACEAKDVCDNTSTPCSFRVEADCPTCRVTGGGVDCHDQMWDGSDNCTGAVGQAKRNNGTDAYTFGGQAGAHDAVHGEWTHRQHDGPSGKWTFHGGTSSAPPDTHVAIVECCDPGFCDPARPADFKQIDFAGIGSFKNVQDGGDDGHGGTVAVEGERRWFSVHIEDLGEPGRNGTQSRPRNSCPPEGFECGPTTDRDCRDCPDFYRILIHKTTDSTSDVVYEGVGYITGGNLQLHPAIGN